MNKAELLALAQERGVAADETWTKKQIQEALDALPPVEPPDDPEAVSADTGEADDGAASPNWAEMDGVTDFTKPELEQMLVRTLTMLRSNSACRVGTPAGDAMQEEVFRNGGSLFLAQFKAAEEAQVEG